MLEKSVPDGARLVLHKEDVPEAVEHPWGQVVELPAGRGPGTAISDVFQDAGQSLLILGEAGSGKTVTLLELAESLIQRAEQDPSSPVPVILHLASWTGSGEPLIDWLAAELSGKYQIPRRMGREWLEQMRLLVMLDGLDEVRGQQRSRCVEAINAFCVEYGMAGICVCSRELEYSELPARLKVRQAVRLRPLGSAQIDAFIASSTFGSLPLADLLARDEVLRAEAASPLMLNIMCQSYSGPDDDGSSGELPVGDSSPNARHHARLFESYVERMFKRKGKVRYSRHETMECLRWLARNMVWQNQSVFLVEQLQTAWLQRRWERWLNLGVLAVTFGLLVGFIGWAFWHGTQTVYDSPYLQRSIARYPLAVWLPACVGWVLGIGLIDVLFYELTHRSDASVLARSNWVQSGKVIASFLVWAVIWWIAALLVWGADFPSGRLTVPYVTGVIVCLLVGGWGIGRDSMAVDIRTVEALRWSWLSALKGVALGVLLGVVLWLVWMVVNNLALDPWRLPGAVAAMSRDHWFTQFLILFAVLGGGTGAIFMGFTGIIVAGKDVPNQGMRLSARSACLAGLTSGVSVGLLVWVISWRVIDQGLANSIWIGASLGLVFMAVAVLWHGGIDVLRHFTLRSILSLRGYTPKRFTEFLDHATELILLRRVGGSYIFIHRLLLEHIAQLSAGKRRPHTLL